MTKIITERDRLLSQLLDNFEGDVEAAEQALRDLQNARRRRLAPKVNRQHAPVVVTLKNVNRQYKLGQNKVGAVVDTSLEIRRRHRRCRR